MQSSLPKVELPEIATLIHQAVLDPHINEEAIKTACDASLHFSFAGLCTNLIHLEQARNRLGPPGTTKLIAAISFPFGTTPISIKKIEAEWAAEKGAEELDVVPNFFALNQGKAEIFSEELALLCNLGLPVRAILNISYLNPEKLNLAIEAAIDAGVSGLQTSNGFGPAVTATDIQQIRKLTRGRCSIKATGGIKNLNQAIELLIAGATELGTSMGTSLMKDLRSKQSEF